MIKVPYFSAVANSALLSWDQEFEAGLLFLHSSARAAGQFEKDDFEDMPNLDAVADTAGDGAFIPSTGHMHVEHGLAFFVREKGAGSGDFMNISEQMFHRADRTGLAVLGADNKPAAGIDPAHGNQGRGRDGMLFGKLFDFLMNDFAVFQPDNENPAELRL